jgi:type I restriction enzyme S subunit
MVFNREAWLEKTIPIPPLPEQRRIVGKIEGLAAKIGEARSLRGETYQEARTLMGATKNSVFGQSHHRWINKSLEEVAPINMGQSPPGHSYNTHGEGIPLLNGPTEFGDCNPIPIQWTSASTKLCNKGDILLCVRGATTGRMNWADREYCIGRGLAALTVDTNICDPRFVYHFVENQTHEMLSLSAGSTFPNLPGAKLKSLQIPVPTQEEQRRIVAYLEDLQAQVDALKKLQAQTAVELDALLPAILDRAFKGEL